MREPKNQMLGTMDPPPLMQLSVNTTTTTTTTNNNNNWTKSIVAALG